MEIKNAIISSTSIDTGDRGLLTAWLQLDYGGSGQGFGGYSLYLPKSYKHFTEKGDFAGHFIFRCMEIAGVEKWEAVKRKSIRVKIKDGFAHAIGNIVKDDWFCPAEDFEKMSKSKQQAMTPEEENQRVLMVIDRDNILIHVGDPKAFKSKLLADYVREGCSFKEVSFKQWKELGYKLYEPIKQ